MNLDILKQVGLTDGEIKVYKALVELGKAPIFKIMKNSKVSSSKVYLILDKLMQKGFVSFNIEEKTKFYQITNPQTILDFANNQKNKLDNFNKEFENLIPKINSSKGNFEKESAQVYTGVKGISAAFENLLKEIKKGEEYYFFSLTQSELANEDMKLFFQQYHNKRITKGVKLKGIIHPEIKNIKEILIKNYQIKKHNFSLPTGVIIGKNRILIPLGEKDNICYEIISKRIAQRYRDYFEKVWKSLKQ